jgi:uncharacterized protein (TIGR02145 family)
MKNSCWVLTALLCVVLPITSQAADKSYAVLNIESDKVTAKDLASLTDFLTTEVKNVMPPAVRVYSWNDVQSMLSQTAKQQLLGCDNDKCLTSLGGELGVTFLIAGTMGGVGDHYILNLKLIDIDKAQTVNRASKSVVGDLGAFVDELPALVRQLLGLSGPMENKSASLPQPAQAQNSGAPQTAPGTVMDVDGNVYRTVAIGTQVWMVENLKTTRYNDGTPIPPITNNLAWREFKTPGYCYYNNDSTTFKNSFGILYNCYTVNTGKLAPKGWHVSTAAEWNILTKFLGGRGGAGGKLKASSYWNTPYIGATNAAGFSALPGGRYENGTFNNGGINGYWWTATMDDGNKKTSYAQHIDSDRPKVYDTNYEWGCGLSVRCIRDLN